MTYAEILMRKGKRGAAAYVQAECNSSNTGEPSRKEPQHLNALLDYLLDPEKDVNNQDTIDWCRWLVGGGTSYEDFSQNIRQYDNTALCGLVWTADFVAFRCRTCGISQCMSLCNECFKQHITNHQGHDFNMFKSQAGGACDCGDSSVMKESGFCSQHHGQRRVPPPEAPLDMMCVAENIMPRIILRLLQHLRINSVPSKPPITAAEALEKYEEVIRNCDRFLNLLEDFTSLGSAMRTVMTECLTDGESYQRYTNVSEDSAYADFMRRSKELYEDALASLPNPDPPREFQDCPALTAELHHRTFLEEIVFWTVKYEFPEKLVCLLLKILPDTKYKEAFTRSFVLHYSRVSMMLVRSSNSDKLSNRIVHVSVQLFSNKDLALAMTEQLSLLHIMVSSLKNMMNDVLISSGLHHDSEQNKHKVVDCAKHVMRHHCYWPLVSDLHNVLCHPPIAFRFMADNSLLTMWFDFIKMFQGMNLNIRISGQHIEFEPNTYYASFSGELEAAASILWAMVSHLRDNSNNAREFSANVIRHCLRAILEWMEAISYRSPELTDAQKASFHLPLHRYFSVFLRQAVKYQGFTLKELLPDPFMLSLLMMHPLRIQAAFYEIMHGLWVRNGLQIRGQAMTYIQNHFCKSMVDADLFLLQVCSTQLQQSTVLKTILEQFQIIHWLSLSPHPPLSANRPNYRDQEQELKMIESCLIFLVSLLSLRTNLGLSETDLARLEMVSLLCMSDKTHSLLYEHMPEKSGNSLPVELFDEVLKEVAEYTGPRSDQSGNMQPGMYKPRPHVWEELFDPIYVLLRAVHRREFQTSIERFNEFAKGRYDNSTNQSPEEKQRAKTVQSPWPPWRLPTKVDEGFEDPRRLLQSKYCHGFIFNLIYKCVNDGSSATDGNKNSSTEGGIGCGNGNMSTSTSNDFITSLAIHLLELALTFPDANSNKSCSGKEIAAITKPWIMIHEAIDLEFDTWYPTDWLSANVRHSVSTIFTQSSSKSVRPARPTRTPSNRIGSLLEGSSLTRSLAVQHDSNNQTGVISSINDMDSTSVFHSMEIDQISDVSDLEEPTEPYSIETPTGEQDRTLAFSNAMQPNHSAGAAALPMISDQSISETAIAVTISNSSNVTEEGENTRSTILGEGAPETRRSIPYNQPLAITGPPYTGTMEIVPANNASGSTATSHNVTNHSINNRSAPPHTNDPEMARLIAEYTRGQAQLYATGTTSSGTSAAIACACSQPCRVHLPDATRSKKERDVIVVNESIISLLLKLHSNYARRPDSYVPISERTGFSVTEEYRKSRVGGACFFIEKVLDLICDIDESCLQSVVAERKSLWPHYHAREAEKDEEREREEAVAKKRRAKERQRQMLEQMAQQRQRFIEGHKMQDSGVMEQEGATGRIDQESNFPTLNRSEAHSPFASNSSTTTQTSISTNHPEHNQEIQSENSHFAQIHQGANNSNITINATSGPVFESHSTDHVHQSKDSKFSHTTNLGPEGDGSHSFRNRTERPIRPVQEYTCCHCLIEEPASEERPMGLVTLIQSTSVLAHKHVSSENLVLPTNLQEERELPHALGKSLGVENNDMYTELSNAFSQRMALLSTNRGWKRGVHIQSCGHHMHFDCRQSYCETLKTQQQQLRMTRDQPLDTDNGEFICPLCRQMANSLLPVPPEAQGLPVTIFPHNESDRMIAIAKSIYSMLREESVNLTQGATPLRAEMSRIMEFVSKITYENNTSPQGFYPNELVCNILGSIARTNLELDVVQRGGTLSQKSASSIFSPASSPSAMNTNKTKFCFAPLMHVLSIHMKIIASMSSVDVFETVPPTQAMGQQTMSTKIITSLSEEWGFLTGQLQNSLDSQQMVNSLSRSQNPTTSITTTSHRIIKQNKIPLLMQDPVAVLLHYVLLLPVNIDTAYFVIINRACYNMMLSQVLLRLCTRSLTKRQREIMTGQIAPTHRGNGGAGGNLLFYLRKIISYVETTHLFDDVEDIQFQGIKVPTSPRKDENFDEDMIDLASLEIEAQLCMLPFLRIASLVRHYLFQHPLPIIEETLDDAVQTSGKMSYHDVTSVKALGIPGIKANEEFIQLLQFLELKPIGTGSKASFVTQASTTWKVSQAKKEKSSEVEEEEDTEMKTVEEFEPDLSVRRKGDRRDRGSVDRLLQDSDRERIAKQLLDNQISQAQQQVSVVDGFNWFSLNSSSDVWNDWNYLELNSWLEEYVNYVNRKDAENTAYKIAKMSLKLNLSWKQPSLLRVPKNYEQILEFYHKRKCKRCDRNPKDPTVCLMCGTMVCLKEPCCKQTNSNNVSVCETVNHALECGGGTGIFLAVNSSTIVVIRGKRACIWGSIYLDKFGEEDKELKRGKPLYLHSERYQLLEHQWLTHKFDHTNKKWVFHRDAI